ncbi:MAG: PAS domain-containing sensor histidine kinase [Oscillospiraceae bacterium]|nr:PAS domain-containing sensor histidine kinase [Oscillospiraceae bacterium]
MMKIAGVALTPPDRQRRGGRVKGEMSERKVMILDVGKTAGILILAGFLAGLVDEAPGGEGPMMIYLLAVLGVSLAATHWGYGVAGAFVAAFAVDLFHTQPQFRLSFSPGFPVALLIMLAIALPTGLLISRLKKTAAGALEREYRAVALAKIALDRERRAEALAAGETTRATLLRSISHDLRTPLTSIMGASAAMLEGREMSEPSRASLLVDIRKSSQWLLRMVENILTLTRLSTETVRPRKGPESAENAVSQAVSILRARFPNCRISVRLPDQPLMTPMDVTLISQVLINLLENAIKYSPESEPVVVTLTGDGDYARFEVADRGRGIPGDVMETLFSPQKRDNQDKLRGAGIGLSICQTIVQSHGGDIEGFNREGAGAKFVFRLPLVEEAELAVPATIGSEGEL